MRRPILPRPLLLLLPGFVFCSAQASTLHVPAAYPAIQPALDAASPGDTVEVGPGAYSGPLNLNLDFGGKDLVLRSREGAAQTIIDCSGLTGGHGLSLHGLLTRAAAVEGLTFRGAPNGSPAVTISLGAWPTLRGCHVVDCGDDQSDSTYPIVSVESGAFPRLEDCVIRDNRGYSLYGIIGFQGAAGGELIRCVLASNRNGGPGGAMATWEGGRFLLEDCMVSGNWGQEGGAIYAGYAQALRLVRCVVAGNVAREYSGGGIDVYGSSDVVVESCTIAANRSFGYSGGGLSMDGSEALIRQSIVSGNCGQVGSEIAVSHGSLMIDCSAISGSGVAELVGGLVTYQNMSVFDPPLFCGAPDCPALDPIEAGDFHLRSDSPCLARFAPCGLLIGALDEGCAAPEPVGACCVDLACYLKTRAACETEDGTYEGDGESCFPSPCVVIPVEETSWGRIKARFR